MDFMHLVSLFLLFVAVGWCAVIVAGWIYARRTGRPELARILALGFACGGVTYAAVLLAVSLNSREVVLGRGERLCLCGFYLDCHVAFAVRDVRVTTEGTDRLYLVDLEILSDARRVTIAPGAVDIALVDGAGGHWRRDPEAEIAVTKDPWRERPFDEPLPAGGAYARTLAFRVPAGVRNPRLSVREGFWMDRLIELVMIGDDDSFLHRRTTMSLI